MKSQTNKPNKGEFNKQGIAKALGINLGTFSVWINSPRCYLPEPTRKMRVLKFWDQNLILDWIDKHGAENILASIREAYNRYRCPDPTQYFDYDNPAEKWPIPQETKTDGYEKFLVNLFFNASKDDRIRSSTETINKQLKHHNETI